MPKPRPTTQHSRVSSIPTSSSSSQLTAPAALQIPASASDSDPYDPLQPNPACSGLTMQAYHHHTNPALTLPTINFNFDELREQMSRFTLQFDEFIEKGRRRLLEEKNEFARNIAHNHERARETKSQIEYYKEKEVELSERMFRITLPPLLCCLSHIVNVNSYSHFSFLSRNPSRRRRSDRGTQYHRHHDEETHNHLNS